MDIFSTKKPDVPKKPEVKIEYNDRSYESYINTGFADKILHNVSSPRDRILAFLNEADTRKGPVERTVIHMYRLKAIDWNSPKRERKEFIWYEERWIAVNWLGIPLQNPIDGHIEGKHVEVVTRPVLDERTGEHIEDAFVNVRETYYIPFTKKNVDEIIANSAHTDKYSIKYTVKFGSEDSTDSIVQSARNAYSYDMFLWPWDKLYEWQYWPIDDLVMRPKPNKSATNLEFKPQ